MELRLDDLVTLKKPHPCGSYEWRVVRLGADIGLKCARCGRRVLLTRADVDRRVKSMARPASGGGAPSGGAGAASA